MNELLLDASVVLLVVFNEPGAKKLRNRALGAAISSVNLAEVAAKITERAGPETLVRSEIDDLDLQVIDFDSELALASGLLRPETRAQGLSLGDRACLATGQLTGATVLTADRNWKSINVGVEIEFVR